MRGQGWRTACFLCGICLFSNLETLAREKYLDEFRSLYERKFAGNDEASKCSVCHFGPVKRSRNVYGKILNEKLTGRNVRDTSQIREALRKLEDEPSEVSGKTFGELINDGVLPASKSK